MTLDLIFLPHAFFQRLSDATLLNLEVFSKDALGVWVRTDKATANKWRKEMGR